LLRRLREKPQDQAAWNEFVERYGGKIYAWCRRWKLRRTDAEDASQQVLYNLVRKLGTYDRAKGSFRGWLKAVTNHAVLDYLDQQRRAVVGSGGSEVLRMLSTVEAREDLIERLKEEFDLELKDEALARVQQRVKPHNWEAFRLTELEGLSCTEAAARLQRTVDQVHIARSRIPDLLREEIGQLEGTSQV
jgi:RNA polymerase sigma factor (sigma-70 family)